MEDEVSFECVRPIETHAQVLFQWRSDPKTLRMSYHDKSLSWDAFLTDFYERYFGCSDLTPLFILHTGKRIGFLRFALAESPQQLSRRCVEISIAIDPHWRGKGLATKALQEIESWVFRLGYDDLYAEVKEDNVISQRLFWKAGYLSLGKTTKYVNDRSFVIFRYLRPLSPPDFIRSNGVFVIAEIGSNWRMGTSQRDRAMAKNLVDAACEAGANAAKFQVFRPETIYVENAGRSDYLREMGTDIEISELFTDLAMPYDLVREIADYCREKRIEFMATPFSPDDFAVVDPLVSRHKIASYEIGHFHLLRLAALSGKPLILSTGAATDDEISWGVNHFRSHGGRNLTLLQCTACYPAPLNEMNLGVIPELARRFQVSSGLSDHSAHPLYAPLAAVAMGATVIEKHFTLSKKLPGPDHAFALEPPELKEMISAIRQSEHIRGSGAKIVQPSEKELRSFARRGLQAISDIKPGEILQEGVNVAILRPGKQTLGVHPKFIVEIEGKQAKREINKGSGIQFGDW